jgi:aryl-alcohol dehydrogenase-like predicted oxidoreductase
MQKLIIGTAQWGLDYGWTNEKGRVSDQDLRLLVKVATELGVTSVDTAASYGDAESRVSEFAPTFEVQTKVEVAGSGTLELDSKINSSLRQLNRQVVKRVLIHDWSSADVFSRCRGIKSLEGFKSRGLVKEVGASVYSVDDLLSVKELWPEIDVVQIPINVLDQRFDGQSLIDSLRSNGTTIQARSIFLQGVLLSPAAAAKLGYCTSLDHWFSSFPGTIEARLTPALAYVSSRQWVDELIVGVTNAKELAQARKAMLREVVGHGWEQYASNDPAIIDPRLWPSRDIQIQ